MSDVIESVECFVVCIPREVPYLGPLADGERPNSRGYILRPQNRTIYPTQDRSVLIRVTTSGGVVGWGETYGICAPGAVTEIVNDLLGPVMLGRNPKDVTNIYDDLYDMMRVRGASGGFYGDALAGIDIALWDICGKLAGVPVSDLLGGQRHDRIPAYVSGLPRPRLDERVAFAESWQEKGYRGFKVASVVSEDFGIPDILALREHLGADADLMLDMHWRHSADEAVAVISELAGSGLYFAEAPCAPEDIDGLAKVARRVAVPIAAGEEWRTVHEARERFNRRACSIVQPEMGHTGITQFMRIAQSAHDFGCRVIPHAAIGVGIFQAASLHAYSTLIDAPYHEYQHSVFDRNLQFVQTSMSCENGYFSLPEGPGLGIEPADVLWRHRVA